MKSYSTREEIEAAADVLIEVGVFRADCFRSPLSRHDVAEIAAERSVHPVRCLADGWFIVENPETVACLTLRRIGGVLESVPHEEASKAIVKMAERARPGSGHFYEAVPSSLAVIALLDFVGCPAEREDADYSRMPDYIAPEDLEARLYAVLARTIDGNLSATRLVRKLGFSGKRTWFNDKFIPGVPFVLHEKGAPIRLLGFEPNPNLHRPEEGCFVGLEVSDCGSRALIEYRVTEEAVESASFNVSSSAKETVAGQYVEILSGMKLGFSLDRKNPRKMAGLGRLIRKRFPDYVSGQNAFVLLDKSAGTAFVDLADAIDIETRRRMRSLLHEGFAEAAPCLGRGRAAPVHGGVLERASARAEALS